MEGKLIKETFGGVSLYTLFTDSLLIPYAKNGKGHGYMSLSIKNCEAIENGYDLDELVKTTFPSLENCGVYLWMSETDRNRQRSAFIKGFQKALELLGDKKFSEEDVRKVIFIVSNPLDTRYSSSEIISSLQQTEFDVEIEMTEDWYDGFKSKPKLDADDCLILRRI